MAPSNEGAFLSMTACHSSVLEVHRDVVSDELESGLQVSYCEVWERRSNSEIVARRTET